MNKKYLLGIGIFAGILIVFSFAYGFLLGTNRDVSVSETIRLFFDGQKYELPKKQELQKRASLSRGEIERQFFDVLSYVENNYVEKEVDENKLFYGAMRGAVASLEDPYSVFLEPEISEQFLEELSGRFEGIGAEIGIRDDILTVIAPLTESPAERAGLLAGDKILAIDGLDTTGIALDLAVKKIRGPKGTSVVLTIVHKDSEEPKDITVLRDTIKIVSVEWEMQENNIAYIKLKYFNHDTLSRFHEAAKEITSKKPSGIILDLRNNPGGLLHTAIEVVSYWTGNKEVVVIEKTRNQDFVGHKAQNKNDPFTGIPAVVLINQGSASGSEIVAGALQDYTIATVVGEKSFGKGSVQDLREFPDGSSVKMTVAKWLTPSGREIDQQGITPDIVVERTVKDFEKDADPQLKKAMEILGTRKEK